MHVKFCWWAYSLNSTCNSLIPFSYNSGCCSLLSHSLYFSDCAICLILTLHDGILLSLSCIYIGFCNLWNGMWASMFVSRCQIMAGVILCWSTFSPSLWFAREASFHSHNPELLTSQDVQPAAVVRFLFFRVIISLALIFSSHISKDNITISYHIP